LLLTIVAVAGIRFIVPERNIPVEVIPLEKYIKDPDTLSAKKPAFRNQMYSQSGKRQGPKQIINISTCDSASLEALPGIGPVLSARIIKYRNLLGGYASVDQLREVYGLSEETFNLISARLKADPSQITKIDINTADYKQLIRLPYFDKYEVTAILKFRELKGKINGMSELVENKLIAAEKADKVKPYLEFVK
jgi:DNA uptake protein ComE-like DNA-binding protein